MDAPSPHAQTAAPRFERLTARDWGFLAICAAVFAASLFVALRYFAAAFPEAAIDFRYDRKSSRAIAERLLTEQRLSTAGMKHVAVFDGDQEAKVFLERSVGLKTTNRLARDQVKLWFWHHRWFKPLQEEELAVDVAPTGEIVSFSRHLPEARPLPDVAPHAAQRTAVEFLRRVGVQPGAVNLVARSERRLPKRLQRIFTFESKTIRTADAPYWHTVTLDGPLVTSYSQRLRVPDQWKRSYRELRSKNVLAGRIDAIVLGLTLIAALWVFVVRLRRADVHLRFLLAVGLVSVILVLGVTLNSYPSTLAQYDTTTSFPAFIASIVIFALVQSVGAAIFLMIVCGSGEVLYRERLPHQLAMPRLWTRSALTSRRVFHSFVLGYTLVAFFVAYQVIFYIVAAKFGAWAPAEIPYDDMLNTALPWVAVLFAGFFPSLSEEFLSRAFSIPFLQRFLRSRAFAIVLAGFIWGFGHTTYPNQPFYIRGLEVGLAGVLLGVLMDFTGLLPLLIWHYTVDAFYTAMLLFRSGNPYYIASAGVAAFLFAFPMLVSIVLYLRNGGFAPDEQLTNATLPTSPPPPPQTVIDDAPLPEKMRVRPALLAVAVLAVVLAGVA
ncbi:MAG TPA: CPBP family intramembrane glutamic endopeptidase, partial [Thermoanaerobaculia bacterium]|nr:CPBP family intramembrane glutamic endopeptidase [Thermoanaerobaculia bacterium]